VSGLRARGGVTVDVRWSKTGEVEAILTADRDQEVVVRHGDDRTPVALSAGVASRLSWS
jgi:alpha-L-fucosidase 2